MDEIMRAAGLFSEGFVCSQSVLAAFVPRFGLEPDIACRIAAPFGGV